MTATTFAAALEVPLAQLSQWANGDAWISLEMVRRVERHTEKLPEPMRVRFGHWPQVRDRSTGKWWRHGRLVEHPWPKTRVRAA